MKKYFIHISYYQAKNDLDRELQDHFRSLDQKIITEDVAEQFFQNEFDNICQLYKQSGRRSSLSEFSKVPALRLDRICFSIDNRQGKNMCIDLLPIYGEINGTDLSHTKSK